MLTKEQKIEIARLSGEGWNVSKIAKALVKKIHFTQRNLFLKTVFRQSQQLLSLAKQEIPPV